MVRGPVTRGLVGALLSLSIGSAWAQAPTLKDAFEAAWTRQPAARAGAALREAANASREAAGSWTPEPIAVELAAKTDRLNRDRGSEELVAGVAIPLWLPGERAGTIALADARTRLTQSQVAAARLRLAGQLRDAWWRWHRTNLDLDLARERLETAGRLKSDVARRVAAGDLAKSDLQQADGGVAAANALLAEARARVLEINSELQVLTGLRFDDVMPALEPLVEPMPEPGVDALVIRQPALVERNEQAQLARRSAELTRIQTRANPELSLATTRERALVGEAYEQSFTISIRIPFASDSRNRAKSAAAEAEAIEAEAAARLQHQSLLSELQSLRAQLGALQGLLAATEARASLARQIRDQFERSFRQGESDLPTLLRIEAEALEATRQNAGARIEYASTISKLRQISGVLPE